MTLRSIPETIESLRVTLRQIEQTMGAVRDSGDLAELKHLLDHRITELEIAQNRHQEASATRAEVNVAYKRAS
jgi:hypothetical protein